MSKCIYVYNYDMFPKHINNQTNPSNLEDSEGYIAHNSSDLFLSHDLSTSGLLSRNFHSASAPGQRNSPCCAGTAGGSI